MSKNETNSNGVPGKFGAVQTEKNLKEKGNLG